MIKTFRRVHSKVRMGKRLAGHLLSPTIHIMEEVYSKMSLNQQYQITVMPHYTSIRRTSE